MVLQTLCISIWPNFDPGFKQEKYLCTIGYATPNWKIPCALNARKKIKGGGCEEKMNNLKLKLLSSDSVCETKFRSRVTSSDAWYMISAQFFQYSYPEILPKAHSFVLLSFFNVSINFLLNCKKKIYFNTKNEQFMFNYSCWNQTLISKTQSSLSWRGQEKACFRSI